MNELFQALHASGPVGEAFSHTRLVAHCLRFERELASIQADLGVIPRAAAQEIGRAAQPERIDLERLKQKTRLVGLPIVDLVSQIVELCADDLGQYAHYGATTQDALDCALALQMQEALGEVQLRLDRLVHRLDGLAASHASHLQAGRTNQQHALPVTFGFKAAVWRAAVDRHRERVAQAGERVCVGQLGGAVGTLASFGALGPETRGRLVRALGLAEPPVAWHAMRDGPAEAALLLAQVGATLGKMARDLLALSTTEVAEVRFAAGRGASSTMPQKNNPVAASSVVALSRLLGRVAPALLDASHVEHERSLDAWYIELHAMPLCFSLAGALLEQALTMLEELAVDTARMARNVDITGGAIVTETVQMALAQRLGLNRAHTLVAQACRQAASGERPLAQALAALDPTLDPASLQALLDPAAHIAFASREARPRPGAGGTDSSSTVGEPP